MVKVFGCRSRKAIFIVLVLVAGSVDAQQKSQPPNSYPNKPVRILVGAAAGGGTDLITRMVGQKLSERWNVPVIVDNRAGGTGVIAMNITAQAPPDGYTLSIAGNSLILTGAQKKVPFDIRAGFDAVVQLTSQPYLLVINSSLPVNSVKDLIAYAKARPGTINYGSSGTGSPIHLGVELFNSMAGLKMVHVPYKGISLALIDAVGGQIQMLLSNGIAAAPHLKSGKLKAIAVSSRRRMQLFSSVPTVAESGLPAYELDNMYGLYAPAGLPPMILSTINRDVSQIVNTPEVKERLASDGAEAAPANSPAEFRAIYLKEIDKWENFLKTSGLKIE